LRSDVVFLLWSERFPLTHRYLRPWKAFAQAGGKGAMTAHNTVLNQPSHANPYLVNTIFREEFQFGDGAWLATC
jgi:beta-glucosidase-like glycosyl hydrolase